jgi:hypothetical protein
MRSQSTLLLATLARFNTGHCIRLSASHAPLCFRSLSSASARTLHLNLPPAAANSNPATSPNLKGQADDIAPFFEMLSEGFA